MSKTKYLFEYGLIAIFITMLTIIFSLWFIGRENNRNRTLTPAFSDRGYVTFVIDAGHGGEDAGAVAADGTLEKDINLKISKTLCMLFELNCNHTVMTRQNDTLLYDRYGDLDNYKGQKKIYDLKNRVRITREEENPVFIGIHMNNFSKSKYRGLQVYFSNNNEYSQVIAENIQKNTHTYIQNDNQRKIKSADSSIYVLHNLSCPAVLVECGFMSNEEELSLFKTKEYRRNISLVVFLSSLNGCIDKDV